MMHTALQTPSVKVVLCGVFLITGVFFLLWYGELSLLNNVWIVGQQPPLAATSSPCNCVTQSNTTMAIPPTCAPCNCVTESHTIATPSTCTPCPTCNCVTESITTTATPSSELAALQSDLQKSKELTQEVQKLVFNTLKHLSVAHRYARSTKTLQEITEAFDFSMKALTLLHTQGQRPLIPENLTVSLANVELLHTASNALAAAPLVCPEKYMGHKFGYGFYFRGYEIENCTTLKPFSEVVSVALNFAGEVESRNAQRIFSGVFATNYTTIPYIVASANANITGYATIANTNHSVTNFTDVAVSDAQDPADIYKTIMSAVRTDYVLLARNVEDFDDFARVERLVRVASQLNADIVSGSHRSGDGHWLPACYQMAMKNYTLRVIEGFDLSYNSCMYCEYSSAPFVIKSNMFREYLKNVGSRKYATFDLFYLDLFLTIRQAHGVSMNCPDAMFHTKTIGFEAPSKDKWMSFVQKWELNRLVFPDDTDLWFTCEEAKIGCTKTAGIIVPLCCIKHLTDCLNFAAQMMDKNGIRYEMDGGTVVGLAKLQNSLPWERDHDFDMPWQDISALMKLQPLFKAQGYTLDEERTDYAKCSTGFLCGYVALRCPNWRIEMWGVTEMGSDIWARRGVQNVTRGIMGGTHWLVSMPNPAQFSRNRYGDDIFKHAEHWMELGLASSWYDYKDGVWLKCPRPGFHGCLSNYLPVGNLQFKDVWI